MNTHEETMELLPKTLILLGILTVGLFTAASPGQRQDFDPFRPGTSKHAKAPPTGVIASLEFVDTPITSIFKMISDLTGWSIIASPDVSTKPPRINVWIKNLTADQVLEQVTAMGGLVSERRGNTINVMTFAEYGRFYGVEKKVLQLKYADAGDVVAILKPFAEKDGQSRILADETGNKVVLLVPKPLLDSFVRLVDTLDAPFKKDVIKIVPLTHLEAPVVTSALAEFLTQGTVRVPSVSKTKSKSGVAPVEGVESGRVGEQWLVQFMADPKLNVIVLRGLAKDVTRTIELIRQLDIPAGMEIRSYEMKFTNIRDAFRTLQEVIKADIEDQRETGRRGVHVGSQRVRIALSEQNNRIIIEGSAHDHERLSRIIDAIDKPLPPGSGGMRVYRLENALSSEVVKVIQDLIEEQTKHRDLAKQERPQEPRHIRRVGPLPGGMRRPDQATSHTPPPAEGGGTAQLAPGDVLPPRVTEAAEINAVIIKASAAEHEEFVQIIRELDKPRDQVLLEVTLVTVRANTGFDLGVELGGARIGAPTTRLQTISFTTFGIGNPDAATGEIRLSANPPFGVNFAVFNSDDFSLVLNALETVGSVHITSTPKILVEDNTEALISQINQEPFEVTSQGEETTVTSFGGFVDAGTVLTVKPHISELDWLRLEYAINQSSFGNRTAAQLAANLPPPRRETKAQGTVRIPAEHMVVLGGLLGTRKDHVEDSVPFLARIPGLGEVFKNRSHRTINETLFIFIRPVVLRDPAFRDLLAVSKDDIRQAKLSQDDYPSNPLKMFTPTLKRDHLEEQ